jgi:hypothetical protein
MTDRIIRIERNRVWFEGPERADTLRVFQDNMPCLSGNMGWVADHTISEPDKGGLRVVKWRPMPGGLHNGVTGQPGPASEPPEAE